MPIILHIETAVTNASVAISNNGQCLAFFESNDVKNHASFIHAAIQHVCQVAHIPLTSIDAIAVSNGPGSYTGLRVGLSTAKGLCFSLSKPLLLLNTLHIMAEASVRYCHENEMAIPENAIFCPMIDARRWEVFTCFFNKMLQPLTPPSAAIFSENFFEFIPDNAPIFISGNGANKAIDFFVNHSFTHIKNTFSAKDMIAQAEHCYKAETFADIAYCTPFYIKDFFNPAAKN